MAGVIVGIALVLMQFYVKVDQGNALIVNTLKASGIDLSRQGVRQQLAGQKRVTVTLKRADGKTIHVRKTTRPEPRQQKIYDALGIADRPEETEKMVL